MNNDANTGMHLTKRMMRRWRRRKWKIVSCSLNSVSHTNTWQEQKEPRKQEHLHKFQVSQIWREREWEMNDSAHTQWDLTNQEIVEQYLYDREGVKKFMRLNAWQLSLVWKRKIIGFRSDSPHSQIPMEYLVNKCVGADKTVCITWYSCCLFCLVQL